MKTKAAFKLSVPAALAVFFAVSGPVSPDLSAQAAKSGISRSMEQAIRLYHEGDSTEAMDRFMDILVKGSPSEKALANEYINKITMRMNTGVNTLEDKTAEPTALAEISTPRTAPKPAARPYGAAAAADEEEREALERDMDGEQRERITASIDTKIAEMRRDILLALSKERPVKVYMGESMPKALTLDPAYFFAAETTFRAGTDKMLGLLSGLLFTLGKANILILPEGSAAGDVKIKSIRQALAINSYFESRGISRSRLEVNLTGTDIRYPKELTNISGIIILFDYDKQPRLKDVEDFQTRGPKVSLGIYPTAISAHNNEGAIVEFSVFDSPVGTPSWKFQIFQVLQDGTRLMMQEISGAGPMYNQSFWNGRKKFFGPAHPAGKYMFTVTAADPEGRDTTLSRLLVVRPGPQEQKALRAAPAKSPVRESVDASGLKSRALRPGARGPAMGSKLKGGKVNKAAPRKSRPGAGSKPSAPAEPAGEPEAEASLPDGDAAPAPGTGSGQVSYRIFFMNNNSLTSASEKRLAKVAETMGYYPMSNIRLTGYSYSGEPDADAVADARVNKVASRLADKYRIDRSRMELATKVTEGTKAMVEIQLTGNE